MSDVENLAVFGALDAMGSVLKEFANGHDALLRRAFDAERIDVFLRNVFL